MSDQISKISLREQSYHKLRDQIITLELKPGTQINENRLERELSIGRTPVREALLRLVHEGYLTSVPGRGFYVCEITIESIRALFEAVMIIERGGIALSVQRISAEEILELEEIHDSLQKAMSQEVYLQVTLLNSKFHRIIHQATRNNFLIAANYNLEPPYHRLSYLCFSENTGLSTLSAHFDKVIADHDSLIKCFKMRDERASVDLITNHVRLFHTRVTQYLLPSITIIEGARNSI
ncbi:MAG: GntR family transcriptional regulator [Syntrophales bacterium]|nr:GntR family transcriptional regulator [Syntrophales bacterium]